MRSGRLRQTMSVPGKGRGRLTTSKLFISHRKRLGKKNVTNTYDYLTSTGLIKKCFSGGYYINPLGQRCLDKLIGLIHKVMEGVGGVKVTMPILSPASLWKQSGRWDSIGEGLFKLSAHNKNEFCLGPTYEEMATNFVSEDLITCRQLPMRLYQLDRKFRNETRTRSALLRAKEFWMKDMYTFDVDSEHAQSTYAEVCKAYESLFAYLNIDVMKVVADPGDIGGSLSHEYHVLLPEVDGADTLVHCEKCGLGYNSEVVDSECKILPNCPQSGQGCEIKKTKGTEVAHAFNLGTKYSKMFNALFTDQDNNKLFCQMGCYGIGVSRLLQVIVEYKLMNSDQMVWPMAIAPFTAYVVPLYNKKSPLNELTERAEKVYDIIDSIVPGDVLLEDRAYLSISERFSNAEYVGYPITVVVGTKQPPGHVELRLQLTNDRVVEIIEEQNLRERLKSIVGLT